ncbi:MAG: folylpolyglutamate synthase/dihydrofolate synthase family protein [Candidatus Micrarchaeota archaeon]
MEVVQYLYSLKNQGSKLGLGRMEKLLDLLGRPERSFKSILVAGTNGKGSTVAMIYSILRNAGFSVGRYISPHITCLNERIVVDDKQITDQDLFRIINEIRKKIETLKNEENFDHPTFFEVTTAATFVYFRERKIDFAVLEVGMGGRLDATNTVIPLVSVITNVSLEHTKILGDSIEKIAYEKGGIIKENGMVVTTTEGEALKKITEICKERNAKLVMNGSEIKTKNRSSTGWIQKFDADILDKTYVGLELNLIGEHQIKNAICALSTIKFIQQQGITIPEDAIRTGLKKVDWPGRMEIVQEKPLVILDCAKDADASKKLAETIRNDIKPKKLIVVISISSDKNISEMIGAIIPLANMVILTAHHVMERATDPQLLANEVIKYNKKFEIIPDVKDAVRTGIKMSGIDGTVIVTGSVFTVAEAREIWFGKNNAELGLNINDLPTRK